ncbi:MAG: GxxExxY protein [Lentisphaeria bacterium]|jgi:GxxExxY protein
MNEAGLFKQEGYALIAAAFEVYDQIGAGFGEDIYQECLEKELNARGISFESQVHVPVYYKGEKLAKHFKPDLLAMNEIVVELKAVQQLVPEHEAQRLNYLKATRKKVGYLINFGHANQLEWKRFVNSLPR